MDLRIHGQAATRDAPILPKSLLLRGGLLLLPLLILGCGSEDKKTAASTSQEAAPPRQAQSRAAAPGARTEPSFSVDPCVLLTKSDAEALAGGPMNDPLKDDLEEPAGRGCRYFTTRESNLSRTVEIQVWESDNLERSFYGWPAEEYFARFKAGHKNAGGDFEQLPGLGDDAYFWSAQVFILKGTRVLTVSARGFGAGGADTDARNKEATIKAAHVAVGRLR